MAVPAPEYRYKWTLSISVKDILSIAGQGPYRYVPMTEQPVPIRPESPRVRVSPIGGEPFEGVVIHEHYNFYVVAPDRAPGHRENWNKGVCELLPE